jgi:hypothetical protein
LHDGLTKSTSTQSVVESLHAWDKSEQALASLDRFAARDPVFAARRGKSIQARLLSRLGRHEECLAVMSSLPSQGTAERQLHLQIRLAQGDLEAAERAAQALKDDTALSRWQNAHFSVTLEGAQLAELRLHRRLEAAAEALDPYEFLVPTRAVVARWVDREGPASQSGPGFPCTVMQFWDRPEVPPEVAATMQTWEDTPGFTYRRFDKSGARAFLRDRLGPDWARAFRAARHPAEQADFFRIAFLAVEGGVYADADDRRIGDLAALVRGFEGALLFVEPFGTVANNFLVARPGHPVFVRAADEARRSLLSSDSGGIWAKTGPGLLTRTVARYLGGDASGNGPAVCLRRGDHFAPVVQFHARMACKAAPEY